MERNRLGCGAGIALALAIMLATLGSPVVNAADPSTGLSEAESQVASAEADIASAEAKLDSARDRLAMASRRAEPAAEAAQATRDQARELRVSLLDRQAQARTRIAAMDAAHQQEVDGHDREVVYGVGFGLAALLGAGIALAWGWFRASSVVAALSRIDLGRALGLCLGGGLLLLMVGAVLSEAEGVAGAFGALLLGLGFVLPTALLLGRHAAEVERGHAKPVLRRDRLPNWVPRGVAVLLLLVALSGLTSSIFTEEPAAFSVPPELEADRTALERGPNARQLKEAAIAAEAAEAKAEAPLAAQRAARAAMRGAGDALRAAKRRLVSAEADERRFSRRLAVLVEREEREAARALEREERESEELSEEEEFASGCDPNYTGCVPPYPPDADCAEVGETVTVVGEDPHGLDADSDLEACE